MKGRMFTFGEVLWDILPTAEIPGGAPMNVAVHASQLGIEAHIISAVGADVRGTRIRAWLEERGMATASISTAASLPTGTVQVDLSDPKAAQYRIDTPVAWDQIPAMPNEIRKEDILVFGSLGCRFEENWRVLQPHLGKFSLRVLDLNLRAPFFSQERVERLLGNCDLLKVNEAEFEQLRAWFPVEGARAEMVQAWSQRFGFSQCCVTRGDQGALLFQEDAQHKSRIFSVNVIDTVGSGDAFLAALLTGMMREHPTQRCLDDAAALGALVAASEGANPRVGWREIHELTCIKPNAPFA